MKIVLATVFRANEIPDLPDFENLAGLESLKNCCYLRSCLKLFGEI